MRMPSSQPLWPALVCSFLLHACVVLGAWYLVASESRVPRQVYASISETTNSLPLSIVFGSVGKARQPTPIIDTTVNVAPPALDTDVQLLDPPSFNTVESTAAPQVVPGSRSAAGTPNNSGSPAAQGVGGHGAGGPGGVTFFQVATASRSVVYVIDRSGSMGSNDSLKRAKLELLASLQQLPPETQFQVVAYNHADPHCLVGRDLLVTAQPDNVAPFVRALDDLSPKGQTNHVAALRCALLLKPDTIFWVTDGDDFSPSDLNAVLQVNRAPTAIHVIEMLSFAKPDDRPIMQLAKYTHGTYRAVKYMEQVTANPVLPPR